MILDWLVDFPSLKTSGTMLARGRRGEGGSSRGAGGGCRYNEKYWTYYNSTTGILTIVINHNPDPLLGIDRNLEAFRGFEESDKVERGGFYKFGMF